MGLEDFSKYRCCNMSYPFSNNNLMILLCDVSIALINGVPPLNDWLSIQAPAPSNNFTNSSYRINTG